MKKKLFLLTTYILSLVIGVYNVDSKEVKADTCEKYTNYYLFLSTTQYQYYLDNFDENREFNHKDIKKYKLGVPDSDEEYDVEILNDGKVELTEDSTTGISKMTYDEFYTIYNQAESNKAYVDGNSSYIRAIWYENDGEEKDNTIKLTDSLEVFKEHLPENIQEPTIKLVKDENGKDKLSDTRAEFQITRTISESDIENISSGNVYLPAVYYIRYEVCPINTSSNKVIKYFVDKKTDESIKSPIEIDLEDGEEYDAYECPKEFDLGEDGLYILDTESKSSFEGGTINGEDVIFECFYNKQEESKKYTLTINFGTDKNCTTKTDIYETQNFEYEAGAKVAYKIPEIDKYEFNDIGSISKTFSPAPTVNDNNQLTLTMPAKNTSICLTYINNSQTGTSWIYLIWIIGIAALAYSGWYFVKFYKNNKNEI